MANKEITSETLKNRYLGIDEKKVTIVEVFKEHNKQMYDLIGETYSKGTWERYETSLRHTIEFLKWKYNVSDMDVKQINPEFVSSYEYWLRTVRKCANNSAVKYIKNFQKIINICFANEWISKNPFINYKSKLTTVVPNFLSQSNIDQILNKEFKSERLASVRDIFIFSCYTGLAYIDIRNLTYENIFIDLKGEKWIKTNRTKTKFAFSIPVLLIGEMIMNKY